MYYVYNSEIIDKSECILYEIKDINAKKQIQICLPRGRI